VADDGCGIPPDDFVQVFERFYRVDKGRSHDSGGTGLGLSIVRQIVTLHGGSVCAKAREEGGVVFSFTLPLCKLDA